METSPVKKVIIPVGGYGTRFLPATKAVPKEMLTIVDKPVIQYLVEEAVNSGIQDVVLITGRAKRAVEDHFDHYAELDHFLESKGKLELAKSIRQISSMASFAYIRQRHPLGIVDAILEARTQVANEPVAVISGDDIIDADPPALKQLIDVYQKYNAPVVALVRIPKEEVYKYGVIAGKEIEPGIWEVSDIVEKPKVEESPSDLAVVVKYIFTPELFKYLEKVEPDPRSGELYIPPAIDRYVKEGGKFYGVEVKGTWYDCGGKLGLLQAIVNYGLKHPEVGASFKNYLQSLKLNPTEPSKFKQGTEKKLA